MPRLRTELLLEGFEAGWGRDVGSIRENLSLLGQVLDSSDPGRFERFLGASRWFGAC